jgi:hypothetical protein
MTDQLPTDLAGWKAFLMEALEEARCAIMTDDDRDVLVAFVKGEAERIYYGPSPPTSAPKQETAWADIGYQERVELDHEDPCPF